MKKNLNHPSSISDLGITGQKKIRIGTRDSELALWQAHNVQKQLQDLGYDTEIIAVKSRAVFLDLKFLYQL